MVVRREKSSIFLDNMHSDDKVSKVRGFAPLSWQALEIIADLVKVGIEDIALVFNGKKLNEDKVWALRFFFLCC